MSQRDYNYLNISRVAIIKYLSSRWCFSPFWQGNSLECVILLNYG